jgi:hypothetical protein
MVAVVIEQSARAVLALLGERTDFAIEEAERVNDSVIETLLTKLTGSEGLRRAGHGGLASAECCARGHRPPRTLLAPL